MTPEQALETIVSNGGTLFDPQVVQAFREAWDAEYDSSLVGNSLAFCYQ